MTYLRKILPYPHAHHTSPTANIPFFLTWVVADAIPGADGHEAMMSHVEERNVLVLLIYHEEHLENNVLIN